MKKIIQILMYMAIICVGMTKSIAQDVNRGGGGFTVDGFTYEFINFDPNEVSLIGGTFTNPFIVPSTVTFQDVIYRVIEISFSAFNNEPSLTSVTIPATIQEIRDNAFSNTSLTEVIVLAETPPTIDSNSFGTRSGIALTVPTGFEETYLNNDWTGFASVNGVVSTFEVDNITYGINSLSGNTVTVVDSSIAGSLVIPSTVTFNTTVYTVTEIADSAFENNQLTSAIVPNTITKIGERAFRDNQLTNVVLPNTITTIGERAFENNQLANVNIPSNVTVIDGSVFRNNQLSSINIPNGITTIGSFAFRENNLTSITIPASVTSIEFFAFTVNPLTEIIALGNTPPTIGNTENTFGDFGTLGSIDLTVPTGTEAAYEAAGWIGFRSVNGVITFNIGVTFTENNFDYEITSLNPDEVEITGGTTFPDDLIIDATVSSEGSTFTVTSVGASAFEDGTLTSVQLPNTIRLIDNFAFQNNQLTSITIPSSVTHIDIRAFRLNQIESVIIPNTVISLGNGAFEANNLSSLTISENLTVINQHTFRSNQLTSVTIPAGITSIGESAFRNNPLEMVSSLNSNPPNVTGNNFFSNRQNIALTVPATTELAYILNGWTGFGTINGQNPAFYDEFEVDNMTFKINSLNPNEVETANTSITGEIVIPSSVNDGVDNYAVTSIGRESFRNKLLTSITIPNSVTNIGFGAFRDNQLTTVVIPASVTNIDARAFQNNPLTTIIIEGFLPPTINSQSNSNNTFTNRSNIDVFVRSGTVQSHINAGWTGFKSITGISKGLALKVYLQGASLNPNTGEENLMRDDLRVANLIPITSPYADAATANANVFTITGEDAIVDWIFVELRDASNNTTIIESASGLLQRDGDIVNTDGVSLFTFTLQLGDYFITIKHRNHLGIMLANAKQLSSVITIIDFADANNPITFGSNAQTDAGMPVDTVGMWTGNVNDDNIVQYSGTDPDAPAILSLVLNDPGNFLNFSTFVVSGYDVNDLNLDGNVQYEGVSPDAPFILQNVLTHPGNFLNFSTFQIQEQLPEN